MREMKALWDAGQGYLEQTAPVLVEKRGGELVEADGGCRLRAVGEVELNGWGMLNGQAVFVERVDGSGSYRVPLAEWQRVNAA